MGGIHENVDDIRFEGVHLSEARMDLKPCRLVLLDGRMRLKPQQPLAGPVSRVESPLRMAWRHEFAKAPHDLAAFGLGAAGGDRAGALAGRGP